MDMEGDIFVIADVIIPKKLSKEHKNCLKN